MLFGKMNLSSDLHPKAVDGRGVPASVCNLKSSQFPQLIGELDTIPTGSKLE
jgi:hypothetical protein